MLQLHRKGLDQHSSQLSILLWRELDLLSFLEIRVKGRLEGVDMDQPVQKTQVYSCCLPLVLLCRKSAVDVLYSGVQLAASKGENSHSIRVFRIWVAVEETVEFFAVAMEVQDESNISLPADLLDEGFDGCDFRAVCVLLSSVPFSVEVLTAKVGAIVAVDHAVRIDHWNHINHVVLQQKISLFALA